MNNIPLVSKSRSATAPIYKEQWDLVVNGKKLAVICRTNLTTMQEQWLLDMHKTHKTLSKEQGLAIVKHHKLVRGADRVCVRWHQHSTRFYFHAE